MPDVSELEEYKDRGGEGMNWEKEIEVHSKDGNKTLVPLADIEEILLEQLTKEEMKVLAGELIKFSEFSPIPSFYE